MLMGILLEYTLRMGVDVRLVSAAASIPPWQEMRWLTQDEMIDGKGYLLVQSCNFTCIRCERCFGTRHNV
jgi:hypothetical protein